MERLRSENHRGKPWPWEADRCSIWPYETGMAGVRRSPTGYVLRAVFVEGYVFDPDREYVPGMEVWKMLHKPKAEDIEALSGSAVPADEQAQKKYPVLWSYMTQTKWEDGTPREPAGLNVFFQDGVLKAMVRDKACGRVLFVAAPGLSKLFEVIEGVLKDERADWRRDKQPEQRKSKK